MARSPARLCSRSTAGTSASPNTRTRTGRPTEHRGTIDVTEQPLDRLTVIDRELPRKKEYTVERARVPLVLKLFGLTALLIVIVVGVAVGITIERANRVANETVNASISGAAKLFRELEKTRLARLTLPTVLLGNDPSFVALTQADLAGTAEESVASGTTAQTPVAAVPEPVAPSASSIDIISIADQLEQRRLSFG